jgi:quercetin dioxygenase-like cupin family protein/DNA-binding XRE family transcriptional regulator
MPPATTPKSRNATNPADRVDSAPGEQVSDAASDGAFDAADDAAEVSARVAARIGAARRRAGLTLAAVASRNAISPAYLSQIEAGVANPTLRALVQIASALDTDVAHLLGGPDETDSGPFRPYVSTAPLAARTHEGAGIWDLTAPGSRRLAARLVQGEPAGHTEPTSHPGEELVIVVNGTCKLHIEDAVHQLEAGDSCHFSAAERHHFTATSSDLTLCVVLTEE